MKTQRLALALTAVNLILLVALLAQFRPVSAEGGQGSQGSQSSQGVAPVLRGRALEIVDAQGKTRANIQIEPATKGTDGKMYPESVVLRLRDQNGLIRVKLGADQEGSGLVLANDTQQPGVQLLAKGDSSVRLTNPNGRHQIVTP